MTETNVPLGKYLCTLSEGCFELSDVQLTTEDPSRSLVTSDHLILSEMAICKIQNIFQDSVSDTLAQSKGAISKSSTSIPLSIAVISITDLFQIIVIIGQNVVKFCSLKRINNVL